MSIWTQKMPRLYFSAMQYTKPEEAGLIYKHLIDFDDFLSIYQQASIVGVTSQALTSFEYSTKITPPPLANADFIDVPVLDLPFKTTIFESLDPTRCLFFFEQRGEDSQIDGGTVRYQVMAIMIHERLPQEYLLILAGLAQVTKSNGDVSVVEYASALDTKKPVNQNIFPRAVIRGAEELVSMLNSNSSQIGISSPVVVREKITKGRIIKQRFNSLIVIGSKKTQNIEKTPDGEPIDWKHSWCVRGHWRRVPTVGKDRYGQYGTPGFTWVLEHLKGKGPVSTQLRIIK